MDLLKQSTDKFRKQFPEFQKKIRQENARKRKLMYKCMGILKCQFARIFVDEIQNNPKHEKTILELLSKGKEYADITVVIRSDKHPKIFEIIDKLIDNGYDRLYIVELISMHVRDKFHRIQSSKGGLYATTRDGIKILSLDCRIKFTDSKLN